MMKKYHVFMSEDYRRTAYQTSLETLEDAKSYSDDLDNQCFYNSAEIMKTMDDGALEVIAWRHWSGILKGKRGTAWVGADEEKTTTGDPLDEYMRGVDKGWPPGYFAETASCLTNDPIERGPQGDYEERDKLE